MPQPWLRVARVVRPHGVRGELVAALLTDFPERFTSGAALSLCAPGAEAPSRSVIVEHARMHTGRLLLRLQGCATRDAAEQLRGWDLAVAWEHRVALDAGSIYLADLVDGALLDRATGAAAGIIIGLDRESSTMDLLVLRSASGAELLVPFAQAYTPEWDEDARTLTMTLPEGLLTLDQP